MSKTRLAELTDEQTARMAEFRDKWIAIGLSTEPADRPRAERAIAAAYKFAGLEPPEKIVWCGSPYSQGIARAIVMNEKLMGALARLVVGGVSAVVSDSVKDSVMASVWANVWASVGANVWASVKDSVKDSVWASVGASVRANVGANVRANVWASVGDSVWANVGDSVKDSVRANVGASVGDRVRESVEADALAIADELKRSISASVSDSVYGQHDARWLSFYDYFREVLGLTAETDGLCGLFELAKSAGWAIPHRNICWVSERPCKLARDASGRLHSLTGPAVAYPDGWRVFSVHGVRVPGDIIEQPGSITVARIDSEINAEVRRVMIEIYGAEKFLLDSNSELVSKDAFGELYRRTFADDEPLTMVKVRNSTPEPDGTVKDYFLRVPPTMTTAHEAVAWTAGMSAEEYKPVVET